MCIVFLISTLEIYHTKIHICKLHLSYHAMQYICKIQPCQQHSDILTSYAACSCLTVFTLPCKVFVQIAKRICPNFKMYLLNFGFPTTFWHCDLLCSTPAAATVLKPSHSNSQLLSTHPNSSSGTGLSGSVQTSHNLLFLWSDLCWTANSWQWRTEAVSAGCPHLCTVHWIRFQFWEIALNLNLTMIRFRQFIPNWTLHALSLI